MSATAKDFYACAESCAQNSTDEGHARSAISRAYYAAMHDCLAWESALPLRGYADPELRGTHNILCARLASPESTMTTELKTLSKQRGYALRSFHAMRVTADYEIAADVTSEDVKQALAEAQRIFALGSSS